MANTLIYAIAQYGISKTQKRLYVNYLDGATNKIKEFRSDHSDMDNPDTQIFNTFETQVNQHISEGVVSQVVVQYSIEGINERMIIQSFSDDGSRVQKDVDRVDMINPDAQIFDNFKALVEKFIIN